MLALGADPTPPGTPAGKFWTRVRAHKDSGFAARHEEMPGMPSIEWVQAARTTRQQYRAPPRFDGVCAVLLAHSALRKPIGSVLFGKRSYAPQLIPTRGSDGRGDGGQVADLREGQGVFSVAGARDFGVPCPRTSAWARRST